MKFEMRGAVALTVVASAALGVASCGDYAPTNPYDSRVPVTLTIAGPDTTYSIGELLTFQLQTSVELPGARPVWTSSDALTALGNGRFSVASATHVDSVVTITATIGSRYATHVVHVRQRAARIVLRALSATGSSAPGYASALGMAFPYTLATFDSGGYSVAAPGRSLVFSVRDTTVARVDSNGFALARGNGSTWLVAELDGRRDSLRLVVQQEPGGVWASPSQLVLGTNDSGSVSITRWNDANGFQLAATPTIIGWRVVSAFETGDVTVATVDANGVVHDGTAQGLDILQVEWQSADGQTGWLDVCAIWSNMQPWG